MHRATLLLIGCGISLAMSGCIARHDRQILTGCYMRASNTYAAPDYCHREVLNVLVLPIDNPSHSENIETHRHQITESVMRGFGKFNYFGLQFDPRYGEIAGPVLDLNTGFIDRAKLGALGIEYNADAVLQVSITEFRPYPPMRMSVKAWLVDTNTGERIWAFDHGFDTDDAEVVNLMRLWWNDRIAGGSPENRFHYDRLRPSVLANFVFYTMAQSYGDTRWGNVTSVEALRSSGECCR